MCFSLRLWVRTLWPDIGSNSFYLGLDGRAEAVFGNTEGPGQIGKWFWLAAEPWTLSKGSHTIVVRWREDGTQLECKDGKCVKKGCQPGTEGCSCDNGSCNEGLECKDGVCVAKSGSHGLSIDNAEARACDVLFDAGTSGAASAAFDSSVIGRFRLKGDKLAVSFTSKTDSPLQGKVLRLLDEAGGDVDAAKLGGMSVTCYDRKGGALSDAGARFE